MGEVNKVKIDKSHFRMKISRARKNIYCVQEENKGEKERVIDE